MGGKSSFVFYPLCCGGIGDQVIRENPASRGTETASEVSKDSSRRTPQDHVTRAFTPLRRRWKESAPGTARRIQGGKAAAEFARDVSTYTLELRSSSQLSPGNTPPRRPIRCLSGLTPTLTLGAAPLRSACTPVEWSGSPAASEHGDGRLIGACCRPPSAGASNRTATMHARRVIVPWCTCH